MTGGTDAPEDRRYTKTHEWVRPVAEEVEVGITDHAQAELTDIVFVDLPEVGKVVTPGDAVLVLESVKTVSDVYAPVGGTVSAVNTELKAHPEFVNQEPYGRGWLYRLRPAAPWAPDAHLSGAQYLASVGPGA